MSRNPLQESIKDPRSLRLPINSQRSGSFNSATMSRIGAIILLVILITTLGCKLRNSKTTYFEHPFSKNIDGGDYLCIHVNSSQFIQTCAGGCSGYFSHDPVYTLGNEDLDYRANRSCSGGRTRCCRALTKRRISVELNFVCVNKTQIRESDPFIDMVTILFYYNNELLDQQEEYTYKIMSEVVPNQETATSCGCAACYGPSGVSKTVCYNLAQPS